MFAWNEEEIALLLRISHGQKPEIPQPALSVIPEFYAESGLDSQVIPVLVELLRFLRCAGHRIMAAKLSEFKRHTDDALEVLAKTGDICPVPKAILVDAQPPAPCDWMISEQCGCDNLPPHWLLISQSQIGSYVQRVEFSRRGSQPPFDQRDQAFVRILSQQFHQELQTSYIESHVQSDRNALMSFQHQINDLSRRQRQVLQRLVQGRSAKQIAADLGLSIYTVNDYIKAIYRRLHVSNRAELMAVIHLGPTATLMA